MKKLIKNKLEKYKLLAADEACKAVYNILTNSNLLKKSSVDRSGRSIGRGVLIANSWQQTKRARLYLIFW